MGFVYNILVSIAGVVLTAMAPFNKKIQLFVSGRKGWLSFLDSSISLGDSIIWMHVASLGEYEQGLPILEKLKKHCPHHRLLITFFSPSGYEVKKNNAPADFVTYLPLDTYTNAKRFVQKVNPKLAIFVKYEIWPNYLRELKRKGIPTLLVSALFSQKQIFFKPMGSFMRKSLSAFTHFFVQDENSKHLLSSIGIEEATVSGDTRFDRVSEIVERDYRLGFMDDFKGNCFCFVAGSTWPEDEAVMVDFINSTNEPIKFVIAPHTIKQSHIAKLIGTISKETVRYSEMLGQDLSDKKVLIIDIIGLLTKIYGYADLAYVGGGFATGLHNTLEPAVYGIPVIVGPKYHGFKEARELVGEKGILMADGPSTFNEIMGRFVKNPDFLKKTGDINANYIARHKGATRVIFTHIASIL